MRPLLPTLREKKRYLVYEVLSRKKIKAFSSVKEAIVQAALSFSGTKGIAHTGLQIMPKWDTQQRGMLRVNRRGVDVTRSSLMFIKTIEGQRVAIRTLGISGIASKAQEKFIVS